VVSPVAGLPVESFLVFCASATELSSGNSGFGGVIFVFSAGETALGALTGVGEPLELPSGLRGGLGLGSSLSSLSSLSLPPELGLLYLFVNTISLALLPSALPVLATIYA